MTLDQLIRLVSDGRYADEIGDIRVEELWVGGSPVGIRPGETNEDAVLRVFRTFDDQWFSSSFFAHHLGLERWTAQKICVELAERGLVDRRGRTSATRYRARPASMHGMASGRGVKWLARSG